jgi:hypothetical protein
MCFQHLKSELGLRVAPSTIPGAGDGLFTTRPRKRGDKIVEYRGELLDGPEVDERYGVDATAPYALELSANDPIIDSACERWTAAYINHKGISQANCRFSRGQDGRAWVVATKTIPADRELTVSYGRDYRFTEPGVSHRTKR